jgi:hypothetical protein
LTVRVGERGGVEVRINGVTNFDSPVTVEAGATVRITASPAAGYDFTDWTVSGTSYSGSQENQISFAMPRGNVSVMAGFAKTVPVAGYIVYSDAIVSAGDLRPDYTPVGIAVNERLMIALDSSPSQTWGPAGTVTGLPAFDTFAEAFTSDPGSGKANSALIAAFGAAANPVKVYPANDYALTYTPAGVNYAGVFFLPNARELDMVWEARDAVNASLTLLGKATLDGLYWTSVQAPDQPQTDPAAINKAWVYNLTPPGTAPNAAPLTTTNNKVLPMAEIPTTPI